MYQVQVLVELQLLATPPIHQINFFLHLVQKYPKDIKLKESYKRINKVRYHSNFHIHTFHTK